MRLLWCNCCFILCICTLIRSHVRLMLPSHRGNMNHDGSWLQMHGIAFKMIIIHFARKENVIFLLHHTYFLTSIPWCIIIVWSAGFKKKLFIYFIIMGGMIQRFNVYYQNFAKYPKVFNNNSSLLAHYRWLHKIHNSIDFMSWLDLKPTIDST